MPFREQSTLGHRAPQPDGRRDAHADKFGQFVERGVLFFLCLLCFLCLLYLIYLPSLFRLVSYLSFARLPYNSASVPRATILSPELYSARPTPEHSGQKPTA